MSFLEELVGFMGSILRSLSEQAQGSAPAAIH
jgi:hypothetical protein